MLQMRLLGEVSLDWDGTELPVPVGRPWTVLAWLALNPGPHSRRELAGSFWPAVLDESARASLRSALHSLRSSLGPAGAAVVTTRDMVAIRPDVWVDAIEFRALAAEGRLAQALELVRGELLEGLDDEWVYAEREQQRDRELELLGRLALEAERTGDTALAIERTRRRIELDPLAEQPSRELMRLLVLDDDRPAALATYARLADRLRRQFGIAPSAKTRELAEALRGTEAAAASAGSPPALALPSAFARSHRSPLVGRDVALAALRGHWATARGGGSAVVLLAGDPGIGKTRLAGELARAAFADGATVIYGRGQEEALAPYQPIAEALGPYIAASTDERPDAELGRVVPGRSGVARTRPRGAIPAAPATGCSRPWPRCRRSGAQARPVLLVLDDLHWIDRPTSLLIAHLATRDPQSLMILGTYRDTELDAAGPLRELTAELARDQRLARLTLEPLTTADVQTLVNAWLGDAAPPELAAVLADETAGNPFFVEQLLGDLDEQRAGARIATAELGIPEGVRDVLEQRLRRLGEDTNAVLALAAVAGREFSVDTLEHCSELGRGRLVAALDAAVAAHLVRDIARQPGRYVFTHALVREAIYETLPAGRRAMLHGSIAVSLEQLHAADPEPQLAELAHHFWHAGIAAGMASQAIEYSSRAGRRAVAQLAYEDAAGHYERALGLVGERDRRCALLLDLGEARLRAGDIPASREAFAAAAALARELRDGVALAQAALGRSGLGVTVLGHDPETVAMLEEALALLPEAAFALRARLLGRLAIEIYHASVPRREQLSADAVRLGRAAGDRAALADTLSARHVALWSPPHLAQRRDLADEIVSLAESAGDRERALQGRNWRVLDLLESSEIAAAEAEIDEHGRLADELRLPGYQWWTPMWQAMLAIMRGEFELGQRLSAGAVEIGHRAGDRVADLFQWIQSTYVRLEREPPEGTPDVPDRMAVGAVQSALRSDLPLLHAEAGRTAEAVAELDALASDGFAGVASDMNNLASLAGLAQGSLLLADAERAAVLCELLAPYRDRTILIGRAAICLGPAELYLAMAAMTCERWESTERHLDAADAWAAAWSAQPWAAWASVWRARMLRGRGDAGDLPRAASLESEALAVADRLGLARLEARLTAAAAQ